MDVNAAAFLVMAAVVVIAALAVVTAPDTLLVVRSTGGFAIAVALILAVANAPAVGIAELLLAALCGLGGRWLLRAGDAGPLVHATPPRHRWRLVSAALAISTAFFIVGISAGYDGEWLRNPNAMSAALVTLIHYRYPIAALMALGLLVFAAGSAFVLGTVSHDERRHHEGIEERRRKDERMARRRTDREAARQRRREARRNQ